MSARVLMVDDEADFLATHIRLLRRQGYDVVAASTRAAALDTLSHDRLSLVISDLHPSDGNGLDVVRAARGVPDPPPVILVTGYPSDEARRAASAAGAIAFFAQSFAAVGAAGCGLVQPDRRPMIEPIRDRLGDRAGDGCLVVERWRSLGVSAPHRFETTASSKTTRTRRSSDRSPEGIAGPG